MTVVMPPLDSLRCFVEAARLLNFRAAARAVALTPAAFGQRIKQLEQQIGVPLFQRTTRSVTLTAGGLALLPQAKATLESARDCVRAARQEVGPPPMELTLGTRHELGLSWLEPMVDDLQRVHAGLVVHLYFGSGSDLLLGVRALKIDAAVTSSRLTDPKLDAIALHAETYALVGAPALLAKRRFSVAEHAAQHTLIDTEASLPLFRYWRDAAGGLDSMHFAAVRYMGTIAAIRARVLRGQGVGVLPTYFVQADLEAKRLRRILPKVSPLSDRFRLVFRGDDPRRVAFESIAECMRRRPLC